MINLFSFISKPKNQEAEPAAELMNLVKPITHQRILVSSNCQTGGVAAVLASIFPALTVVPLPLPGNIDDGFEKKVLKELDGADVWISMGAFDLLEKHQLTGKVKLIRIPRIRFTGFHPDLVYARRKSTNQLIDPHYNSAIVVWAYQNGLSVEATHSMFTRNIFDALGYLDHWGEAVKQQKEWFRDTDIDFSEFFLAAQRQGCFMHSINHPHIGILVVLAKLIANKLGADEKVLRKHVAVNDGLNDVIWPLYPEIGEELALYGNYEWKLSEHQLISGLTDYISYAFDHYRSLGIAPDDIIPVGVNQGLYNKVLGTEMGGGHG